MSVLWVTNLAPPYRIPVWAELARGTDLTIGLLEPSKRMANDRRSNRGSDWSYQIVEGARIREYNTVRVVRGENAYFGLADPRAAIDLAKSDVVLMGGWESPAYWQLLAQAKAMGKATVGFHESTLMSQSRNEGPIARARSVFFRSLDRVVVPGIAARDAVLNMGVTEQCILTGFNAVDSKHFIGIPAAEPHQGHRFLYVGQLIPRKNLEVTIKAFSEMAQPADLLTLVGRGELRDALGELAHRCGVRDQVEFVEYLPNAELPPLMAKHDTLVLASHVEVWGLVVNEALATGMQAVVTANCGVAPSVEGMPGVLLAASDASDLAETMRRARDGFAGRIADPPIVQHTPEAFAGVFARALAEAVQVKTSRKGNA